MFVDSEHMLALDDEILKVMQSSQAILTHDVKARELFSKMVKKAQSENEDDEDEDEKKEKEDKPDWKWILNCVIMVISKEDFNEIRDSAKEGAAPLVKQERASDKSLSPVEHFFKQLEQWGGIETSKLMHWFCELEDHSLQAL